MKHSTLGFLVAGTLVAFAVVIVSRTGLGDGLRGEVTGGMTGTMSSSPSVMSAPAQEAPESIVLELDESTYLEDGVDDGSVTAAGTSSGWGKCKTVSRSVRISETQSVTTKKGEAFALAEAKNASDRKVEAACGDANKAPLCARGCTGVPGSARVLYKTLTIATLISKKQIPNTTSFVYRIKTIAGGCNLERDCK